MKAKHILLILLACLVTVCAVLTAAAPDADTQRESLTVHEVTPEEIARAAACLPFPEDRAVFVYPETVSVLPGEETELSVTADEAGEYLLAASVRVSGNRTGDCCVLITTKTGAERAALPVLWHDAPGAYAADRYGNETVPDQLRYTGAVTGFLYRADTVCDELFTLALEKGENRIVFSEADEKAELLSVWLVRKEAEPAYAEYRAAHAAGEQACPGTGISVQAENYTAKSASGIVAAAVRSADVEPYVTGKGLINTLDGGSTKQAGAEVIYTFTVDVPGWYAPEFRYAQMHTEDMSCYRTLKLDGQIPFAEAAGIPFGYTGYSWELCGIPDGNGGNAMLWLESGEHTLSLTSTLHEYSGELAELSLLADEIRDTALAIRKVTGNSADRYRTWNMEEFVPGISELLSGMAERVDRVYDSLREKCGGEPSFAGTLKVASANLRMLAAEPERLPSNMALFSEGSSCVSQRLADVSDALRDQGVDLDRIVLNGTGSPRAEKSVSLWQTLKAEAKKFVASFSGDTQGYSNAKGSNGEKLVVWMNRPLQYVTLLQQMADAEFTARTGIPVEIFIMPSESKLVLSNAAGDTPDVALSVANQTPYNLALRGAAAALSDFEDFYPFISRDYNIAAYSGLILNNRVYGALETSDFYIMVYRKDILKALDIPVPETWEDVIGILPKLQRYGMNFFTPIAGNKGSKYLHETTPYLFQAGAQLLSGDGFSVDFTGEEAYNGFKMMTDLYLKYSLTQDTPNFYNHFRYGLIPIGITNYSTYILLKNAAPEIAGQWEMTLVPGTRAADGSILRCQVAGDKTDLIFASSEMKEEGWEFLKWWLSSEVQSEYANRLLTRYGPEYFWNTANMTSFSSYPMDKNDIDTVLTQWKENTKELQKHPASYMIEREISNVWSAVTVNGKDLRTALVQAETNVNREIRQKLTEFGYMKDGEKLKDYPVLTDEELYRLITENGEGE